VIEFSYMEVPVLNPVLVQFEIENGKRFCRVYPDGSVKVIEERGNMVYTATLRAGDAKRFFYKHDVSKLLQALPPNSDPFVASAVQRLVDVLGRK